MKLEDIPKKSVFNVPDGYFEQLPSKIQTRISVGRKPEPSFVLRYKLQYVIPAIVILAIGFIWLAKPEPATDVNALLASVETEQLVVYLNDSDLTTEDVIDEVDFTSDDIEEIESEVYQKQLGDDSLDALLDDIDLENL